MSVSFILVYGSSFILSQFVTTGIAAYGQCTALDIKRCLSRLTSYQNETGITGQYSPIYDIDNEQLTEYCKYGSQAMVCLATLRKCESLYKDQTEGLLQTLQYLCVDTIEEYRKYIGTTCYGKGFVVSALNRCNKQIEEKFSHFNAYAHGASKKVCSLFGEQYHCIKNAVTPHCASEAADWLVVYVQKANSPAIKRAGCDGLSQEAIIAISVCCVIIGISLLVVVIYFCRKRNYQTKKQVEITPNFPVRDDPFLAMDPEHKRGNTAV